METHLLVTDLKPKLTSLKSPWYFSMETLSKLPVIDLKQLTSLKSPYVSMKTLKELQELLQPISSEMSWKELLELLQCITSEISWELQCILSEIPWKELKELLQRIPTWKELQELLQTWLTHCSTTQSWNCKLQIKDSKLRDHTFHDIIKMIRE